MYKREHKFFGGCLTGFAIFVLKMYAEAFCPSEALHSSDFLKVGKKTKQMQAALSQYLCNRQKCPPSWPSMVSGSRLCQETVCQFVLFQILIFFGHNTFLFISTTSFKPTDFTQLKFQMHAVIVCVAAVANFFMTPYLWMLFLCRSIFKFHSALCWHWIYHKYIFKRNKWFGYEYYRYVCFLVKS